MIVIAGVLVVYINFGDQLTTKTPAPNSQNIDRAALAKIAPKLSNKGYHTNFKSEQQCITCHTTPSLEQQLGAPQMPHEPRERCTECHKVVA